MTTAMMISKLTPFHDDELVADIDAAFDAIDRQLAATRADHDALLLDVEWLVDELLEQTVRFEREALDISLELTAELEAPAHSVRPIRDEVAEVA